MFTLKDIRNQYTFEKQLQDKNTNFWVYLFNRKLSFYPTWLFLRLGLSANQITLLSIIVGLVGCVYFSFGGRDNFIIGAIFINVWAILDCVDGNMARLLNSSNKYGWFLDSITGFLLNSVLLFSLGIGIYFNNDNFIHVLSAMFKLSNPQIISISVLIIGCLGSISALFYALIIHLYKNIFTRDLFDLKTIRNNSNSFIGKIIAVARYFTGFGLIEPLLIFAALFNYVSIIVLVFGPINVIAAVYVSIKAIKAGKIQT